MKTGEYSAMLLVGALCLSALTAFVLHERTRAQHAAYAELVGTGETVAKTLEGALRTQIRRGRFNQERLTAILNGVVNNSGVRFVEIRSDGQAQAHAGSSNAPSALTTPQGCLLAADTFLVWRTVRFQDCPLGSGHGNGMGPGMGLGRSSEQFDSEFQGEQLLVLGLERAAYDARISSENTHLLVTAAVGIGALLALLAAWAFSLHNRLLNLRLQTTRARNDVLEEVRLAAAGLAHETKNPLGVIRGLTQQIREKTDDEGTRLSADAVLDEVDTTTARLGDFMAYARPREPHLESIDAREFVARIATLLKPDFDSNQVLFKTEVSSDTRLKADSEMLRQVVLNLLLNSLQATPRGRSVTLRIRAVRNCAEIEVLDDGTGIGSALLPRIFKPYVSGRPGGHGLGLAIVARIVEAHGWRIGVESTPGGGTRFTISDIVCDAGRAT